MNITPRPVPAHKLPPPSGTDPIYLQSLIDSAIEQFLLADTDDGRLPYFAYIEEVKIQLRKALGHV